MERIGGFSIKLLTRLRPMEFSIEQHTIKSGWSCYSIVYIEGAQVIISKKKNISMKIDFVLANSADPD